FSYMSGQAISSSRKSNWLYPTWCWIRRFCINYSGFRKSFFRHGRSYVKQGRTEEGNERNENKKTGIFSRLCTIDNHYFNRYRLRSEEHTSELQSRFDLVCRLLLDKKKLYNQLIRLNKK